MQAAGMFTVFSYMAVVLKDFIGATPFIISMMFLCFGITGVIGNLIGARAMDRVGAAKVGMIAMGCMLTAIVLWPLTRGSLPITVLLTFVWGLGCFAINGAQQARLIGLAPNLSSASVALNSSAIYLGQATGAFIGGLMITAHGTANLSYVAAVFMALAMLISRAAANLSAQKLPTEPAIAPR
jgi:predicted MFS family arabinose efflux permease